MIEQVEEVRAKFEILPFRDGEAFCERKIQIDLPRSPQTVSTYIADICADRAGRRRPAGTWNGLACLHKRSRKNCWVEEIAGRHGLSCIFASHSRYQARSSQWVCSLVQSVE